ncbi:alcohol dehydrogenase [Sulfurisphaera javensis]|uniref:Alcohol dehydrogenase n=1 Tax=Sulfurisphaera javensis TaxID=2049879 RepID=A0AAT9GU87_9CREN
MKAIVFDLGITLKDVVEKPVYRDYVQVSPLKVLISGLENSIYTGILWVQPGRILGSTGFVKIEAAGLDSDNQLEGKQAIILPYSKKYGGIGTEIDGILAEKSVIPDDSIVTLPSNYPDKYILYPFVSIGLQLRKILRGYNVLIIGDGLTGLLSAYMLVGNANKIGIYSDDIYKIKIYGVEEIKDLSTQWDAIVITTMRSWIRAILANTLINSVIVIPRFMNTWPVVVPNNVKFVEPTKLNGVFEYIDDEISEKFFNQLVGISEDFFSSIPTSKPGILVNIEKTLFKKV